MATKRTPPMAPRSKKKGRRTSAGTVENLMEQLTPEQLAGNLRRDRLFTMRVSEGDRRSMQRAATACELSTAEYLLRLHQCAYNLLDKAGLIPDETE